MQQRYRIRSSINIRIICTLKRCVRARLLKEIRTNGIIPVQKRTRARSLQLQLVRVCVFLCSVQHIMMHQISLSGSYVYKTITSIRIGILSLSLSGSVLYMRFKLPMRAVMLLVCVCKWERYVWELYLFFFSHRELYFGLIYFIRFFFCLVLSQNRRRKKTAALWVFSSYSWFIFIFRSVLCSCFLKKLSKSGLMLYNCHCNWHMWWAL